MASALVGIACLLDFLDGFAARMLGVSSPLGKDLDSLADMVTFGVVPGFMIYKLNWFPWELATSGGGWHTIVYSSFLEEMFFKFLMNVLPFIIPVFSAIRLAKFNNDTRQSESFIGLPTPANAILICSLPLILAFTFEMQALNYFFMPIDMVMPKMINEPIAKLLMDPFVLGGLTIVQSFLLVAPLPLFALKFKSFGWKGNEIRYIFLGLALVLLISLQFVGIPLVIILYILISLANNLIKKRNSPSP